MPEKQNPEEPLYVGRERLAYIMGVTPIMVTKLTHAGMPKAGHGRYDLAECVQWYLESWRERTREARSAKTTSGERQRYDAARADRAELENAQMRGELVDVAEIRATVSGIAATMCLRLDAMPSRLSPALAVLSEIEAVHNALTVECRDIREAIAADLEARAALDAGGAPDAPAAENDGESVGGPAPISASG